MKTITLNLAAGTLVLGPMLAATIRDNKEAIAKARSQAIEAQDMLELTCTLAYACAKRAQPDITLDAIENLVDMENFQRVFSACWGVSVPEPAEGEGAVQASPST